MLCFFYDKLVLSYFFKYDKIRSTFFICLIDEFKTFFNYFEVGNDLLF
jgi:hypothetical protein